MHFRLIYVEKGAIFPQHCYKEAREILHILYANEMAALGTCEEWTKQIEIDNIFSFLPTEHKILKVCTYLQRRNFDPFPLVDKHDHFDNPTYFLSTWFFKRLQPWCKVSTYIH